MFGELQATIAILSAGEIVAAQQFYGDFTKRKSYWINDVLLSQLT